MTEQLATLSYSTLQTTITAGQTTLVVASAATFSTTGSFRIAVTTVGVTEVMQVTNVSGSTFTIVRGTEGTSAAAHNAGDVVAQVFTAAGLQAAFAAAGTTGTVTTVTGTAPIVITSTPTTTPNVTINAATDGAAGSMSAADKTKLDAFTGTDASTGWVTAISGAGGTGGSVALGATVVLTAAAGAGGLSFGAWTGATALPTGNLSWAGAAAKTLSLVTSGGGAVTITGGAAGDAVTLGASTATATHTPTGLTFGITAAPVISTTIAAVNTVPTATTISAQSASLTSTTGTAANTTGAALNLAGGLGSSGNGGVWQAGSINLQLGSPSAAGTEAYVNAQRAGSTLVAMGAQVGTTTNGAIYLAGVTPNANNYALSGTTTTTTLNSPSSTLALAAGNSTAIQISSGLTISFFGTSVTWASAVAAPALFQQPAASTSAGSGATGKTLSLAAQAGQAATGASNNGGAGGALQLSGGAGGTSGSATAGIGGPVSIASSLKLQTISISSSTYVVDTNSTTGDIQILSSRSATGSGTLTLPAAALGRVVIFKDSGALAATSNQTISPASGTIDGAASYVVNVNKASVWFLADATNWWVIAEYNGTVI